MAVGDHAHCVLHHLGQVIPAWQEELRSLDGAGVNEVSVPLELCYHALRAKYKVTRGR
jgi:hypothetical protein